MTSVLPEKRFERFLHVSGVAPAAVAVAAVAAFGPVLPNPFVAWDDHLRVINNLHLADLRMENLRWMWTDLSFGNYEPVAWMVMAATRALCGPGPEGLHLVSLLLHAAVSVAFFFLLRVWTVVRATTASSSSPLLPMLGAMVFAVHPLQTECVAWISAQHYPLAALFLCGTVILHLRRDPLPAALGFYVLSLLSMPVGVPLPFIMPLLEPHRRPRAKSPEPRARHPWGEWGLYLAASALSVMITLYARTRASSLVDMATHGPPARLAQAAYHIRFVVQKFVWPSGLSPLYQRPDVVDPWSSPFFSSLLLVSVAGLLLVLVRKHRPGLFTAGLAFVLLLSPVAGAVQSGPQLTADRYAYVPSMALLAALVLWGENRRKAIAAVVRPRLVVALATALLTAATMKTHRQIRVWSHSAELWLRVVEVDPGSYVGRHALGTVLDSLGRRDLAEEQYRRALSLQPTFTPSILALARVHRAAGRLRRAEALESLASRLQSAGPSTRRIEAATP